MARRPAGVYDGWRRDTSLRIYELAPDHPKYPEDWRTDEQRRSEDALAASADVRAVVDRIAAEWTGRDGFIDGLRQALLDADRRRRLLGDTSRTAHVQEAMDRITATFLGASYALQPTLGVAHAFIVDYLARHILPADIAPFFLPRASPVHVIANAEDDTVVMVALHPGEFVVKGSGVGRKAIAQDVGRFITEAQDIIDREHGRRRKPGPKASASPDEWAIATRVRQLKHQKVPAVEICKEVGLPYQNANDARYLVRKWSGKAEKLGTGG